MHDCTFVIDGKEYTPNRHTLVAYNITRVETTGDSSVIFLELPKPKSVENKKENIVNIDKINFLPSFIDKLIAYAKTHDSVLFRYGDGCDFMQLKSDFVMECLKETYVKIKFASFDIESLSALDRLALYVLDEASKNI